MKIQCECGASLSFFVELKIVDEGCNLLISNHTEFQFQSNEQAVKYSGCGEVVLAGFSL